MIVYIESNFVLEVALEQEESKAAEDILGLVEEGRIKLVLPTFALIDFLDTEIS